MIDNGNMNLQETIRRILREQSENVHKSKLINLLEKPNGLVNLLNGGFTIEDISNITEMSEKEIYQKFNPLEFIDKKYKESIQDTILERIGRNNWIQSRKNKTEEQKIKELINSNEANKALTLLDRTKIELNNFLSNLANDESKNKLTDINEKNENIKLLQEKYADSFSKNQSIKKESIKRNERIKAIETEVESWKSLFSNSQKMVAELTERKNKLLTH